MTVPYKQSIMEAFPSLNDRESLKRYIMCLEIITVINYYCSNRISWLQIQSKILKPRSVLINDMTLVPLFRIITDLLVFDVDEYYVVLEELHMNVFCHHYHSYEVSRIRPISFLICKVRRFLEHCVLELHENSSKLYVLLKYNIVENIIVY